MPLLLLPSDGVSAEGGLSVVNGSVSGEPVMCCSVPAPTFDGSVMNSDYPMAAARNFSERSGPDSGRLRSMADGEVVPNETTVPLLPCVAGDETLEFASRFTVMDPKFKEDDQAAYRAWLS